MANPTLEWNQDATHPKGMRAVYRAQVRALTFVVGVDEDWSANLCVYEDTDTDAPPWLRKDTDYGDQVAAQHAAGLYLRQFYDVPRGQLHRPERGFRLLFISGAGPVDPERLLLWLGIAFGRFGKYRTVTTLVCTDDTPADRYAAMLAAELGWHTEVHRRGPGASEQQERAARDAAMVAAGAHAALRWPGMGGSSHCMRLAREAGIPIMLPAEEEREWNRQRRQP